MSIRIIPDDDKPYTAIEIALEKPLPDYDLEAVALPTPRDVDSILVSQGFRDLIDDARGILMELLSAASDLPGISAGESKLAPLNITDHDPCHFEIVQLTGAICSRDDEDVYLPGLWIVIRDTRCKSGAPLSEVAQQRIAAIAAELVRRLEL
jgi:hypothetical protein